MSPYLTLAQFKKTAFKQLDRIDIRFKGELRDWIKSYQPPHLNRNQILLKDVEYTMDVLNRIHGLRVLENSDKLNAPLFSLRRLKLLMILPTIKRICLFHQALLSGSGPRGLGDMVQIYGSLLACIPDHYHNRKDFKINLIQDFFIRFSYKKILTRYKTNLSGKIKEHKDFNAIAEKAARNFTSCSRLAAKLIFDALRISSDQRIIKTNSGIHLIHPELVNLCPFFRLKYREYRGGRYEDFPFVSSHIISPQKLNRLSIRDLKELSLLETKVPSYSTHPQLLPNKLPLTKEEIEDGRYAVRMMKIDTQSPTLFLCTNKAGENIHKSWPSAIFNIFLKRLNGILNRQAQVVLMPSFNTQNNIKIERFASKLKNIKLFNLEAKAYYKKKKYSDLRKIPLRRAASILTFLPNSILIGPDSGPTHFYGSINGNAISLNASILQKPQSPQGFYACAPRLGKDNSQYTSEGLIQLEKNTISPPSAAAELASIGLLLLWHRQKYPGKNNNQKHTKDNTIHWIRASMWKLIRSQREFGKIDISPFLERMKRIDMEGKGGEGFKKSIKKSVTQCQRRKLRLGIYLVEKAWMDDLFQEQLDLSEWSWNLHPRIMEDDKVKSYYSNLWHEILCGCSHGNHTSSYLQRFLNKDKFLIKEQRGCGLGSTVLR